MSRTDWSTLIVAGESSERSSALPGLCVFFYFDRSVREIASELAAGIERYVTYVGLQSLSRYTARSGLWKDMSPRQLNKDLKHLRNFPGDHEGAHLNYDSEPVPGPFGIALDAGMLNERHERAAVNMLRLDFPHDWLANRDPEEFLAFVQQQLAAMNVQSCNAGFAFKHTTGTESHAIAGINRLVPRYIGFDPCFTIGRYYQRDHVLSAHWLNYINTALIESAGGSDSLTKSLVGTELRPSERGLLIRSAKLPGVGDINSGALDIGTMPDVARALKPIRVERAQLGQEQFRGDEWLARMDELPARTWDNSHV